MEHKTKVTVTYKIEGEETEYEIMIPIKGDESLTVEEITAQFTEGMEAGSVEVMADFANALIRHMIVHTSLETGLNERR